MSYKLVCDRCKEEINPPTSTRRVTLKCYPFEGGERFDLCVGCAFWLDKFLKDEIRIERKENETN